MTDEVNSAPSHAILDKDSRLLKAKKIETIAKTAGLAFSGVALEVGCGAGFICAYLSRSGFSEVHAVDVVDERQTEQGFSFQVVENTELPFPNESFDFIVSNHVIEHVGSADEQKKHLNEIYRTLKPGGGFYFAVPNRWRLIEPHYRLPFLSWLPEKVSSIYMRWLGKGAIYDCRPLSDSSAREMLEYAGFSFANVTVEAISVVGLIEGGWLMGMLSRFPGWIWKPALPIVPTIIFVCKKPVS